ncbi:hypothetical protein EMCRGX_G007797 [Ephydatia muelleri]
MELVSIRNINNIAVSFTTGPSTSTSGRGIKRTAKNTKNVAEVSKSRKTTRSMSVDTMEVKTRTMKHIPQRRSSGRRRSKDQNLQAQLD